MTTSTTTTTGHTLTIRDLGREGLHLEIEGDVDTMAEIPEGEIKAYCAEHGVRCTWETSSTTSYRVVRDAKTIVDGMIAAIEQTDGGVPAGIFTAADLARVLEERGILDDALPGHGAQTPTMRQLLADRADDINAEIARSAA